MTCGLSRCICIVGLVENLGMAVNRNTVLGKVFGVPVEAIVIRPTI